VQARAPKVELVWTGPERFGSTSRDTKVVVADLFARAQHSVLVSSYSLSSGAHLFAPLAARMTALPNLRVRMFFDLTVQETRAQSRAEYEARFVERFRSSQWPAARLPELFHDPRTIEDHRISLHAKCVVVDEEIALVTSAPWRTRRTSRRARSLKTATLLGRS
jgi:phosphatidylserine/phosphatidylglycerophosphate/cardiolipin synthase-like enzyme